MVTGSLMRLIESTFLLSPVVVSARTTSPRERAGLRSLEKGL